MDDLYQHSEVVMKIEGIIQATYKERIFCKDLLKKTKKMVFGNGVKNIQAAAHNGARTVCKKE